ncbi:hypothetical protein AB6802_04645 [Mesorhizobium sp. RCC_202]|uniref:hypothetical protein n=1 Tax=Mesorhizobium sp. RCC_202 TaxID=3239222 RepID=UPI0035233500
MTEERGITLESSSDARNWLMRRNMLRSEPGKSWSGTIVAPNGTLRCGLQSYLAGDMTPEDVRNAFIAAAEEEGKLVH